MGVEGGMGWKNNPRRTGKPFPWQKYFLNQWLSACGITMTGGSQGTHSGTQLFCHEPNFTANYKAGVKHETAVVSVREPLQVPSQYKQHWAVESQAFTVSLSKQSDFRMTVEKNLPPKVLH